MRSKTSFFNGEIIRRTVFRRYWPIMAMYGLIGTFAAFMFAFVAANLYSLNSMGKTPTADEIRYTQTGILQIISLGSGVGGAAIGIILSRISFGYLFNSEQVQFFHALPLKREALFFSNYIAGVLLFALPIVFSWIALWLFSALMGITWMIAGMMLPMLLVLLATHLFFYSFAVLIAHLTGHGVAHLFVYAVFNFLSGFLYLMATAVLTRYLWGFNAEFLPEFIESTAKILSPLLKLYSGATMTSNAHEISYLYGLAGLALIPVSLLLYKKRRLETNGDVIAFGFLKPIFQAGFAVCFMLIFTAFSSNVIDRIPKAAISSTILLFSFVGFYLARMLINKTFHVFKGSLKGAGIFMAAVLLCVCTLQFDLIGYESRIPKEEDVAFVICSQSNGYYGHDEYNEMNVALNRSSRYDFNMNEVTKDRLDPISGDLALLARKYSPRIFEERENIQTALAMHRQIIDHKDAILDFPADSQNYNPYSSTFEIAYMLKDGSIVKRTYGRLFIDNFAEVVPAAETLFNSQEQRMKRIMPPQLAEGEVLGGVLTDLINEVTYAYDGDPQRINKRFDAEAAKSLYDAILADAKNGNISTYYPSAKGAFEEEVSLIAAQIFFRTPIHPFLQLRDIESYDKLYLETNRLKILTVCITTRSENVLAWMEAQGVDPAIVTEKRVQRENGELYNWHYRYNNDFIGRIETDYNGKTSTYAELVTAE